MLLLVLAVVPLVFFLLHKLSKPSLKNFPPGPPGLPFFGNIIPVQYADELHMYLWNQAAKFGPILSLNVGYRPTIVIQSAKVAEEALKANDFAFSGRPPLVAWKKLSYDGFDVAFAPYNDYWREMRKLSVVHLFTTKRVQSFKYVREDELKRMISKISKCAEEGRPVDLSDITIIYSSSVICRIAFGKRYEEDGKETKRFHRLLDETQDLFTVFFYKDYFKSLGWLDWLLRKDARLEKIYKEMDDFYQEIIDEHLDPNKPVVEVEDFMDVLIGIKNDKKNSSELTWEQIKGVLMNVFVAGSDSGAANLVWGMTAMMLNPRVRHKLTNEIRTVVADKGIVEESDVEKLPYLKATVKELMRVYPVAPLLVPRETQSKTTIAGYEIPANTLVYVNSYAIGRDPEAWEKPNEFYPERFIGGKDIDFKGTDYELIPFGAGRRICPGIYMGALTVEVGLANFLYSFDWELPQGMKTEDIDISGKSGIVLHKKVPLCLVPKKYVHAK